MITVASFDINGNDSVANKWNSIFEKAWLDLAKRRELNQKDTDSYANGQTRFTNVGHYLSYISNLVDINPVYLMLPADEAPFVIDANTRTIDVPRDFSQCSGVESDNYAEIITFTIDRYFDYMDLSEATIAVQWKNTAANTEGLSLIKLIDLDSLRFENKIRFGWPLTKEMTKKAGNLQFAVRFFTRDSDNNFNYLFNTTTKSIPIKATLELKEDMPFDDDVMDYFKNSVVNSQNPFYGEAAPVTFYYDLPGDAALVNDEKELRAYAKASDLNAITYRWYYKSTPGIYCEYKPYNEKGLFEWPISKPENVTFYVKEEVTVGEGDGAQIQSIYTEFDEEWPVKKPDDLTLYVTDVALMIAGSDSRFDISDTGNDSYRLYEVESGNWPTTRPAIEFWKKDFSTGAYDIFPMTEEWPQEPVELYVKDTYLKIKPDSGDITGEYWVQAWNEPKDPETNEQINSSHAESIHCKILPPGDIATLEKDFKLPIGKFLSTTKKLSELKLAKDENGQSTRTYTIYKDGTPVDGYTNKAVTSNDNYDTVPAYEVSKAGTYGILVTSELNRGVKTEQDAWGTTTFYNPAATPKANVFITRGTTDTINTNSLIQVISTEADFELPDAFTSATGDYKGKIDTSNEGLQIIQIGKDTDDYGTLYKIQITEGTKIETSGESQSLIFTWERDGVKITKDDVSAKGSLREYSTEGNTSYIIIAVTDPDEVVSYRCIITNSITVDGITDAAESDTYSFVLS